MLKLTDLHPYFSKPRDNLPHLASLKNRFPMLGVGYVRVSADMKSVFMTVPGNSNIKPKAVLSQLQEQLETLTFLKQSTY